MQCNAMQCNAMKCNAMQCNAIQCNAMQCNVTRSLFALFVNTLAHSHKRDVHIHLFLSISLSSFLQIDMCGVCTGGSVAYGASRDCAGVCNGPLPAGP
jgi:hypothetical protein